MRLLVLLWEGERVLGGGWLLAPKKGGCWRLGAMAAGAWEGERVLGGGGFWRLRGAGRLPMLGVHAQMHFLLLCRFTPNISNALKVLLLCIPCAAARALLARMGTAATAGRRVALQLGRAACARWARHVQS